MEAWWSTLTTPLQVFYAIGIGTSLLLLLQLAMLLLGFDGDADADAGGDGGIDGDAGIHVLSVRTVVAFFTGFGWGGVVALKSGLSLAAAIAVALAVGGALTAAVYFLMRALYGLRESGTLDYKNAIGTVGGVYLPVPGAMKGSGQVEVMVQGRLKVVRAFTRAAETLANQTPVRVVGVVDQQTVLVEPVDLSRPSAESEA